MVFWETAFQNILDKLLSHKKELEFPFYYFMKTCRSNKTEIGIKNKPQNIETEPLANASKKNL